MANAEEKRKIGELHEYARHMFQLSIGWFTFFATVNYATMGWLSKTDRNMPTSPCMIKLVAALFITQNILGIVACFTIRKFYNSTNITMNDLEKVIFSSQSPAAVPENSLPIRLYKNIIVIILVALFLISLGWNIFCKNMITRPRVSVVIPLVI